MKQQAATTVLMETGETTTATTETVVAGSMAAEMAAVVEMVAGEAAIDHASTCARLDCATGLTTSGVR